MADENFAAIVMKPDNCSYCWRPCVMLLAFFTMVLATKYQRTVVNDVRIKTGFAGY